MTDIKQLKNEVKQQLDNKTVAEILIFIGYEITRDYKFVNDKSFSISKDGYIKDLEQLDFQVIFLIL